MSAGPSSPPNHPYAPAGMLGVMVPYGNFAVEWELQLLLGYPNFTLTTRIIADEGQDLDGRLQSYFEPARLSAAMRSFGSTPIECVGIACSATSYFIGQAREAAVFAALERQFATRFTWSTEAIRAGLRSLGSGAMHLVSPYPADITRRCVDYWIAAGFEIEAVTQIGGQGPGHHPIYSCRRSRGSCAHLGRTVRPCFPPTCVWRGRCSKVPPAPASPPKTGSPPQPAGSSRRKAIPACRSSSMPELILYMYEGRSLEQKRDLVRSVTEAVCTSLSVPPDAVTIQLIEGPKQNRARAGRLFGDLDPGDAK
jgi:4-oxalocrotonate tautomerase